MRALARERAARDGGAAARLSELSDASRPRARSDTNVTVASRSVDGLPDSLTTARRTSRSVAVAAAGKIDFAALDAMEASQGDAEWQCLATAIYFESRGEPISGQIAVAEVILNRVDSKFYPKTICAVTNQGVGTSGRACQFSFACDGHSDRMTAGIARSRAEKLATLMLAGVAPKVTGGATHFHTRAVRPDWSRQLTRTTAIGHHLFYR